MKETKIKNKFRRKKIEKKNYLTKKKPCRPAIRMGYTDSRSE